MAESLKAMAMEELNQLADDLKEQAKGAASDLMEDAEEMGAGGLLEEMGGMLMDALAEKRSKSERWRVREVAATCAKMLASTPHIKGALAEEVQGGLMYLYTWECMQLADSDEMFRQHQGKVGDSGPRTTAFNAHNSCAWTSTRKDYVLTSQRLHLQSTSRSAKSPTSPSLPRRYYPWRPSWLFSTPKLHPTLVRREKGYQRLCAKRVREDTIHGSKTASTSGLPCQWANKLHNTLLKASRMGPFPRWTRSSVSTTFDLHFKPTLGYFPSCLRFGRTTATSTILQASPASIKPCTDSSSGATKTSTPNRGVHGPTTSWVSSLRGSHISTM